MFFTKADHSTNIALVRYIVALLKQLSGLKLLLRQELAIRGHTEFEGNLNQLLIMWAGDFDTDLKDWLSVQLIHEYSCSGVRSLKRRKP